MKNVIVVIAALTLLLASACKTMGDHSLIKVAGGEIVERDNPGFWSAVQVVRLEEGKLRGYCTGTLIAKNLVVTASHCNVSSYTHVRFVNHERLDDIPEGTLLPIVESDRHKEYDSAAPAFDVAFVKFVGDPPAEYSPVRIFDPSWDLKKGSPLLTVGFGSGNRNLADIPKLVARGRLVDFTRGYWTRGQFYAETLGEASLVPGDSGGPTYIEKDGEWYLLGISTGDNDNLWPMQSQGQRAILKQRFIGTIVSDHIGWVEERSGIDLVDVGPGDHEWVEFGDAPLPDDNLIGDMCRRRNLSRDDFYSVRAIIYRLKELDCDKVSELASKMTHFSIREKTSKGFAKSFPLPIRLTVYGEVDLDLIGIDLSRLTDLNVINGRPGVANILRMESLEKLVVIDPPVGGPGFAIEKAGPWLNDLPKLRFLALYGVKVSGIAFYINKPSLDVLHIKRGGIETLAGVERTMPMSTLNLSENKISNVKELGDLPVEELNLSHNEISDIRPLAVNLAIQSLVVIGNPLEGSSCPLVNGTCVFSDASLEVREELGAP